MSETLLVPARTIACDPEIAFHRVLGKWRAQCPCGWHAPHFTDILTAGSEADAHLGEAA